VIVAIRVLLVDDQTIFRQGIRLMLEEADLQVVGEANSGEEAIARTAALRPDVVLMEISIPGDNGIAATRVIRQRHPASRVLILTGHTEYLLFREAAEAGAAGYVLKDIAPHNLITAIRAVHSGGTMLSPAIAKRILDSFFAEGRGLRTTVADSVDGPDLAATVREHGLTPRETEVLAGLVERLSDRQIAERLSLSETTVKTHLRRIYQRLRVRNRAEAAAMAVERKLLGALV